MAIVIPEFPQLAIDTLDSLRANEAEILSRISKTPRGGCLFVMSPLDLLKDMNVVLADNVLAAIIKATPVLATTFDRAYQAAKASAHEPTAAVNLKGLFEVIHK
jgi:hypothetical protein